MNACSVDGCEKKVFGHGYCQTHYARFRRTGSAEGKKVESLPSEKWAPVHDCDGYFVSNMGRVKSCKSYNERLIKTRKVMRETSGSIYCTLRRDGRDRNSVVHMEVLRAFHGLPEWNSCQPVFLDGDTTNCRADNLKWADSSYYQAKARKQYQSSSSPLARMMLAYMDGNNRALDFVLSDQSKRLIDVVRRRIHSYRHPAYISDDDIIQDSIVQAMVAIRKGRLPNPEKIDSWFAKIAVSTLMKAGRMSKNMEVGHSYDFLASVAA